MLANSKESPHKEAVSQCHCEESRQGVTTKQSRKASKLWGLPRSLWSLTMTGRDRDATPKGGALYIAPHGGIPLLHCNAIYLVFLNPQIHMRRKT